MKLLNTPKAIAALTRRWARAGETIGFVPTMGALHEGHATLIRRARKENDRVIVSIFVNPLQFGPNEDYGRYPRALPADSRLCRAAGADAIYHPSVEAMYPEGFRTHVEVEGLSDLLDGAFRPGHFRGVATVVLKLLSAVGPTRAYFGEKDYQQLTVLRRMARDLDLPYEIVGCPTARAADGLALSSRNAYLSPEERAAAPALHAALQLARALAARRRPAKELLAKARAELRAAVPELSVDYLRLVDAETLEDLARPRGRMRLLVAARLGKTRLIDNIAV